MGLGSLRTEAPSKPAAATAAPPSATAKLRPRLLRTIDEEDADDADHTGDVTTSTTATNTTTQTYFDDDGDHDDDDDDDGNHDDSITKACANTTLGMLVAMIGGCKGLSRVHIAYLTELIYCYRLTEVLSEPSSPLSCA